MDLNRRSLLKFFGAGASVVPLIGGEVVRGAEARLIEVPKVEPVIPAQTVGVLPPRDALFSRNGIRTFQTTVIMQDASGHTYTFQARTFATDLISQQIPLRYDRCEWTMRGQCVEVGGALYTIMGESGWKTTAAERRTALIREP